MLCTFKRTFPYMNLSLPLTKPCKRGRLRGEGVVRSEDRLTFAVFY